MPGENEPGDNGPRKIIRRGIYRDSRRDKPEPRRPGPSAIRPVGSPPAAEAPPADLTQQQVDEVTDLLQRELLANAEQLEQEEQTRLAEQREAMDRANERNRVQLSARMLPPTGPLPEGMNDLIVEEFKEYLDRHGIKAAQVGREIGYAASVMSSWLKGNYAGNSDAVARKVNSWKERDARRRESQRPRDYVQMWVAEDLRTYCYMADRQCRMAVLVAPSGMGKTKVLEALAEEMQGLYVCCSESMTLRGLYMSIAVKVGWLRATGNCQELERFIIEQLTRTKQILLVDEAHLLGPSIKSLRTIHDQAKVPVVMAGTDEIETAINDRAHGRGQFNSRCIFYNALDHVRGASGGRNGPAGKDLFSVQEIKDFFAKRKIRIDKSGLQMIWSIACLSGYGCLRLVESVIEMIFVLDDSCEVITRDDVTAALQMLGRKEFSNIQSQAQKQMAFYDAPAEAKVG